jgi:hypothetical protein
MKTVKASSVDAVGDCAGADPDRYQLAAGDYVVLARGEARDPCVPAGFVAFLRHIRKKATNAPISPPFAAGLWAGAWSGR